MGLYVTTSVGEDGSENEVSNLREIERNDDPTVP